MEVFKKSKYAILMDERLFEEDFLDRMAIPQVFIYRQLGKKNFMEICIQV